MSTSLAFLIFSAIRLHFRWTKADIPAGQSMQNWGTQSTKLQELNPLIKQEYYAYVIWPWYQILCGSSSIASLMGKTSNKTITDFIQQHCVCHFDFNQCRLTNNGPIILTCHRECLPITVPLHKFQFYKWVYEATLLIVLSYTTRASS